MTKWIFLGDDSRWQFVCWLLKIPIEALPLNGRKTILIKHSFEKYKLIDDEVQLCIATYNLLPDMEIFIPTYGENVQFDLEKFDRCAIFETYPLGRESTEDLAAMLEASRKVEPMILFVLMDLPDEFEGEPIIDVKTRKHNLINKNRDALIARSDIDVLEILHWHRPLVTDLRRRIQHELADIRRQADLCSDYYEEYIQRWRAAGCLNPDVKASITSFANVKGRPHIWKCYNEAAQKVLFPPIMTKPKLRIGSIYEAVDLYQKILYNPNEQGKNLASFIWNLELDLKRLIDKLLLKFTESMKSPKKYHDFLNNDEFSSEHIYKSIVDKPGGRFYGIKDEFFSRYERFVCNDVLEIITNELINHIDQLKGMVVE